MASFNRDNSICRNREEHKLQYLTIYFLDCDIIILFGVSMWNDSLNLWYFGLFIGVVGIFMQNRIKICRKKSHFNALILVSNVTFFCRGMNVKALINS